METGFYLFRGSTFFVSARSVYDCFWNTITPLSKYTFQQEAILLKEYPEVSRCLGELTKRRETIRSELDNLNELIQAIKDYNPDQKTLFD